MIDILKLADLAKLYISEDEKLLFSDDLENIISLVNSVAEFDDNSVSGCSENAVNSECLRNDLVKKSFDREKILENAKEKTGEYICVPRSF